MLLLGGTAALHSLDRRMRRVSERMPIGGNPTSQDALSFILVLKVVPLGWAGPGWEGKKRRVGMGQVEHSYKLVLLRSGSLGDELAGSALVPVLALSPGHEHAERERICVLS